PRSTSITMAAPPCTRRRSVASSGQTARSTASHTTPATKRTATAVQSTASKRGLRRTADRPRPLARYVDLVARAQEQRGRAVPLEQRVRRLARDHDDLGE